MTKPIMYPNRLLWEEIERQLVDGIWQIVAEGKLDLVNFDALPAGIHAVVLHHPLRNDVRVIQSFYDDDNYKRFMFNAPYRSDYWLQDGWYAYFLTDHKGFQNGELTMTAHLFVAEGYDKYPEAFDPMTIAKELAVKAATPSKPLNAPMVHILNCSGQTVDMATLNDNTFVIEGEAAFVGPIEVSIIDPNGANKVKQVQTEGLMRNYRTWKCPLTKVRTGQYKIHVRSLDNAARDYQTLQFSQPQPLELITINPTVNDIPNRASTWDDMLGLATTTWHGVESVGESLVLGAQFVDDFTGFDFSQQKEDLIAGSRVITFIINTTRFGVSDGSPLFKLIKIILETYYQLFPECALLKMQKEVLGATAYSAGKYLIGMKIAKVITHKITAAVLASTAFVSLSKKIAATSVASDTGVGTPISFILTFGLIEKSKQAAEQLKQSNPIIYKALLDQGLLGGYFIVAKTMQPYLQAINYNEGHPTQFEEAATSRYC